MSKINNEFLKKSIAEMLTNHKQRKFVETVELQVGLRDYDPEKRFNGTVRLPNIISTNTKVIVLANAAHIEEANANNIPYIDIDGLKAFNKDKTKIKKYFKKYDVLLASDSVAKQITKLLGNVLVKLNKFPIALSEGEKITERIKEVQHTVKFQSKKASCLGTAIAKADQTEEQIRQNLTMSINFLVSLMKKGWQNVGTLNIKTTMGKPIKIFGWMTNKMIFYSFMICKANHYNHNLFIHILKCKCPSCD